MESLIFTNATLVMPDHLVPQAWLQVHDGVIAALGQGTPPSGRPHDCTGHFLMPGMIDLHVHGGAGADFMDLTPAAFHTVARCHARHGTTTLTPTSTVATRADYLRFLQLCTECRSTETGGARLMGGHLYGPYFHPPAKGCHPTGDFLQPNPHADAQLLAYAGTGLTTLTIAPETPGTQPLVEAARSKGCLVTAGHSYATYAQMEQAIAWGVRHVDHLFCAMSDRARLRQSLPFPMRAGVMEATIAHDELTTEVIADGWHLHEDLLKFAYRMKGPDRLALVTDAMRAVDQPDGEYWFGPEGHGERIRRRGEVGVTLDGTGLASSVMGMDHMLRTMLRATGAPLYDVVRMATATPARILGLQQECGSLQVGLRADLVLLSAKHEVRATYVAGKKVQEANIP